jgi:group II intron reverse transcriptase/maturase
MGKAHYTAKGHRWFDNKSVEVRVMRDANTILFVIQDRGSRGLPLERVYRLLFNKDLYLRAYAKLYPNKGAMTKGVTGETVDGMSLAKIDRLIDNLRHERHRWKPARRTYIPKKNGKRRPLGIPSWTDKLLQEVLRQILEAYFEPQFADQSHGFRPNRGCHTALQDIRHTWTGTRWFIEGDIAQYFDTISHEVLMQLLSEHIHDGRFLRLLRELLEAGYLEDWKFHASLSGAPQGGVLSPLLSNIYLNSFDHWVTQTLIPQYTRGDKRKISREHRRVSKQLYLARQQGDRVGAKAWLKHRRTIPSIDPDDPGYRRLRYIRYADDFLLGFAGPHSEAQEIKRLLTDWLQTKLRLTLSDEKTLITHATTQRARFLGYEITTAHAEDKLDHNGRRIVNGRIGLRVPAQVIEAKCARYFKNGVTRHRPELLKDSDYSIVVRYQQEYRGVVQYYLAAQNVSWLDKLHWVMRVSLLKTLAAKHRSTVTKMATKYRATTQTPSGKQLGCLEVRVEREGKPPLIARFGGISLTWQPQAILDDKPYVNKDGHTEILQRLLADVCEICGSREHIEVHHIRKLADLKKRGRRERPRWAQLMAARQRKTLVVCRNCHDNIHAGRPTRQQAPE